MKNQYFGDINDYVKYGLLRCFANAGFRIGLCWMLTPEDDRPDGKKTYYLFKPQKWERHDPELFKFLSITAQSEHRRRIRSLEVSGLIPRALFYGAIVPDGENDREQWFKKAIEYMSEADLLFFDPDNGIEVPSKPIGRKDSSKYISWKEMKIAWDAVKSIMVFQHFPRIKREVYIETLMEKVKTRIIDARVFALRTANVLYLMAYKQDHEDRITASLKSIRNKWYGPVRFHPDI